MTRKIVWLVVSCLMVAALVLASCAPAVVEEEEVVEEEVAPVVKEPQHGGTLILLRALDPMTFDPADINWQHNDIACYYAETLLTGDLQKGPRGTNEYTFHSQAFIPDRVAKGLLAESWEVTPETLTFKVRQGIYWQDKPGVMSAREFTADDLVYHFTRQLEAPKEYLLKPFVDHFSAPDKYTFVVHMKEYNANWGYRIAWGYFITVASTPEFVEAGPADWKNVVGTGPWMLTDYVPASSLTYQRNPNYWGTTVIDGKEYKLPFADKLVTPIMPDESTQLAALRTRKVDIDRGNQWKYKDSLEETNPELQRWRWVGPASESLALRMDKPPLDDRKVRLALSMAIDRKAITEAIHGGSSVILQFPYSSFWGREHYTPIEELPESTREQFEYNPEKAKQLLAEAGYPDGFKTEIIFYSTGTLATDEASMIAGFWQKIGVECELKPYEYASYYSVMLTQQHEQCYLLSTDVGNPLAIMRKIGETGQRWNPAMHSDPWFDETLTKAQLEADPAVRAPMLKELNIRLLDSVAYIQIPTAFNYAYAQPWVKNWYGEQFVGAVIFGPIAARIWIDQDMREEMTGKR